MGPPLLLFSAIIPALFLLWYLCSRDANPEPPGVVIRTFLLGALATGPIVPVAFALEGLGAAAMGMWPQALVGGFLGAAIPEELFKFLVLRLWVWNQKDFDEPMDGIVYGAAASLGFAALENVLYVSTGGFGVATLRAVTAVPGHALTGVVMGYYAGRAKFAPPHQRTGLLVQGVGAAMLLHGLYDTFLLTGSAWAAAAVLVMIAQLVWARRLIATMRAEQLALRSAPPPALAAPVGLIIDSRPAIAVAAPRLATHQRTPWSVAKLVLGALGASLGSLFVLLSVLTARDLDLDAPSLFSLALAAMVAMMGVLACLWLFRSGLRGPFVEPGMEL
jgi:RsiW-degrading membrane proteinase PrsW (M82 family)